MRVRCAVELVEFPGLGRCRDDMARPASVEPVGEIVGCQQGRGRDDHGAQFHRRQHDFPQRHDVAEHQQDAVAAVDAESAQTVGDAIRTFGQFGEC